MKQILHSVAGSFFLLAAIFLTGCRTADRANSGQMASLQISGRSEADILRSMKAVFLAEGYEHMGDLTWDKKGSAWDAAAYGGWSLGAVWVRLKATVDSTATDDYVIGCNAYMVNDRNQGVMEEERKMSLAGRSECKKILDEVKARLDSPVADSSQP
jgi:hypothetical protein